MLKIGTTKMGSVVDCPRCHKSVVVPPQSTPQAEQLYQMLKNRKPEAETTSPPEEDLSISEPAAPESAWNDLGDDVDPADWSQWIDQFVAPVPDHQPEAFATPLPPPVSTPDIDIVLLTLQKRHKHMVVFLRALSVVTFFIGIAVGIFLAVLFTPPSRPHQPVSVQGSDSNEVTGELFYLNENGDRRADADAVIICLPKDRVPSPLFSCQGLRPEDTPNNDTIHLIHELGGMYGRADANGSFTLQYREGVRYVVILISAHQKRTDGMVKPSALDELRRYFRDCNLLGEHCLHIDEYEWSGSKHPLGRHTFESVE